MSVPELRVEVARGFDEVAAIRDRWARLDGGGITTDYEYYRTVVESEPSMLEPLVLTVLRDGEPAALVVARIEDTRLPLKLGYRTVLRPRVSTLTVVYRGFLGELDEATSALVVRELTRLLGEGGLDLLLFRRLDVEHPLFRAATSGSFLVRQHHTRLAPCWERSLPATFDEFLGSLSKSTRSGIKRYSNKLEREFAGRLEVRRFVDPADLDDYFRDADAVAARSYQRGLGVGVRDEESQRVRARLSMERGWFRAYVLYLDGAPVAFCGGEAYNGRFYYSIPGYDPAFAEHRVGTYVLMQMIEDLCEDETINVLDFGPGDAEYKRRFGDRAWNEADVHVFSSRARPVAINLARTAILKTNDALAAGARSLGVFSRVKQGWRRRAASHADEGSG